MRRFTPRILLTILLTSCATLPSDYSHPFSWAYTDTANTPLAADIQALLADHPGESGFYLLETGVDAFVARMQLTSVAERSIDMQYYLFENDISGRLLVRKLLHAADRGVRVRLLLDDFYTPGKDKLLAILEAHQNIEVRLFNPFAQRETRFAEYLSRFSEVTRRMHNKAMIVDNQVSIVGGRNIGDEYFDRGELFSFYDLDVMSIGPIVPAVSYSFDIYWNHPLSFPITALHHRMDEAELARLRVKLFDELKEQLDFAYRNKMERSKLLDRVRQMQLQFYWGNGEVIYDVPEKLLADARHNADNLYTDLQTSIREVHSELVIVSPYFIPADSGVAMFKRMVDSGIRVIVLTNSLAANDVPAVHTAYRRYRVALLKAGVELYEMKPLLNVSDLDEDSDFSGSSRSTLHTKAMVFDRDHMFIGSFNLDPRSIYRNTEMGMMVDSERMAKDFVGWLEENISKISYRLELVPKEGGNDDSGDTPPGLRWIEIRDGHEIIHHSDPEVSLWLNIKVFIYSLLPLESHL